MARDKTVKSLMMGYEPVQWVTGEVITADKLNHTENGLVELYNELTQNYAKEDGNYPEMSVGYAKQLLSKMLLSDKVPYLFRTPAGGLEIGDREFPAIVGGSVGWNQLVQNGDFDDALNWNTVNGSMVVSDNEATVTVTDISTFSRIETSVPNRKGHKYFISASVKAGQGFIQVSWCGALTSTTTATGSYQKIDYIIDSTYDDSNNWKLYVGVSENEAPDKYYVKNVILIDLTLLLGSTIADYIYTLESTTAEAGVAKLKSWGFLTEDYYAYNAGTLKSVEGLESHDTVGFNQWDEEWELGQIDATTGENISGSISIRSKNFIRVIPGVTYFYKNGSGAATNPYFYDANKNYIGRLGRYPVNETFVIPNDTHFMRLAFPSIYGTTYNHDICINLHWDGERDGEYEPYVKHSYPLDSSLTLRGIPKLDASYNLYYDGDIYESDGTVTRNFGERPYESGDESLPDVITDGTTTIYKLETPTTETADYYTSPQTVSNWGTEEFVTTMDIPIPVGHETEYIIDLKAKLESAPDNPDSDGYYLMKRYQGENSYVEHVNELPTEPTTDGSYTLKSTVTSGESVLSWEPDVP